MSLPRHTLRWWIVGAIVFFIIDRALKWLAVHVLPAEGLFILPKTTGLILERNQGIAYSIPLPQVVLCIIVSLIICILVFFIIRAYRRNEISVEVALGLIIIGALSNFLDRIRYGYVVDMIVLTSWPVFNLADIAITAGVIWLGYYLMKENKKIQPSA
jgi:signal peptidase II